MHFTVLTLLIPLSHLFSLSLRSPTTNPFALSQPWAILVMSSARSKTRSKEVVSGAREGDVRHGTICG